MTGDAFQYCFGVDGGQTSTKCALITTEGRILAYGAGGGLTHLAAQGSRERFVHSLHEAFDSAWATAGLEPQPVTAIGLGLTGVDSPDSLEAQKVRELLPQVVQARTVVVQSDAYAALIGAHGGQPGIVAIAGTGSNVMGIDAHGRTARAGGWGWLLGDEGSAMWIGRRGLSAALQAFDGVGQETRLEQFVLDHFKTTTLHDVKRIIYDSSFGSRGFAALASAVSQAAQQDDNVAREIIMQAGKDLAAQVMAVQRRLALADDAPISPIGGAFEHVHHLRNAFSATLREMNARANVVAPQHPPVIGAALMALKLCDESTIASSDGPTRPSSTPNEAETLNLALTEGINPNTMNIGTLSTLEMMQRINDEDARVASAVAAELPNIARAVDAIVERMRAGGRLIYVGAGTSGRLGVLDASEMPPTFNVPPDRVIGVIAGGPPAITRSIEGAEDDVEQGQRDVAQLNVTDCDVVVGIASSGRTPYVLGALSEARMRSALTISLVSNADTPMHCAADIVIAPLVGPEVISGSTRMKAGTATKLVLNMISTGAMIKLGKTFGNLMVEVQPGNSKLRDRARRIVERACGISAEEAAALLAQCDGEVKTAIVAKLGNLLPDQARVRLARADGVVRKALDLDKEGARRTQ